MVNGSFTITNWCIWFYDEYTNYYGNQAAILGNQAAILGMHSLVQLLLIKIQSRTDQ